MTRMIDDVVAESGRRLTALSARCSGDIRRAAGAVGAFSPAMAGADRAIKGFLYPRGFSVCLPRRGRCSMRDA
jgi:dGTPase